MSEAFWKGFWNGFTLKGISSDLRLPILIKLFKAEPEAGLLSGSADSIASVVAGKSDRTNGPVG